MKKRVIAIILAILLILTITGCSNGSNKAEKLMSSEDYPFEQVFLKISDTAYSTNVISWEYVSDDMIHIIAERRVGSEDNTTVYTQEYLLHESNVVFQNVNKDSN